MLVYLMVVDNLDKALAVLLFLSSSVFLLFSSLLRIVVSGFATSRLPPFTMWLPVCTSSVSGNQLRLSVVGSDAVGSIAMDSC
jgi:hypothetical protein